MPLELQRDLIESAKSGGACLGNLIAAIWPEAYRIALSILHDDGLAQDAAQDACSSIARSLKTLKNVEAFHAWGYRIIVNHAISVARQNPRAEPLTKVTHCPIQFDHSEALDLYNALAELSPVQRGAIVLHYYAGLNSAEIARPRDYHARPCAFISCWRAESCARPFRHRTHGLFKA